uniref:Uncharacterized protein n=1 Tax=Arundo donax TaxID=35708 RepID=A0A0A8ZY04_ARUDO
MLQFDEKLLKLTLHFCDFFLTKWPHISIICECPMLVFKVCF